MRLFSYSCKAKDVRKFFVTHKNIIQFLLQEYRTSLVIMNIDAGRRCKSTTKNVAMLKKRSPLLGNLAPSPVYHVCWGKCKEDNDASKRRFDENP